MHKKDVNEELIKSILILACAIRELGNNDKHSAILNRIAEMEKKIMSTQQELTTELRAANAQLRKLITDTGGLQPSVDALKLKISDLEALVAAGGTIGPDLVDAVAETRNLVGAVDDNVPELPSPPVG